MIDGKLYCSPGSAASALVVDPSSGELSSLHRPELKEGSRKCIGIAAGADGKLYCSPWNAASVLVVDPCSGQPSSLQQPELKEGGEKYFGIECFLCLQFAGEMLAVFFCLLEASWRPPGGEYSICAEAHETLTA